MMKRCCDFALAHVALAWVAWAVAVSAASAAPAGRPGENLARGKTYTLFPRPNYKHCTDPGDATQLTDGQTTDDYFWTQRGTVGWQSARYITVTVDLGRVEPIAGVSFCTAAGTAGVRWPGAIRVLTSDDGKGYRDAGELVALDRKSHGPWPEGYAIRRLITYELQTRGRFVRFLVLPESGSPYTFVDEVEVFPGPAAWLQGRPGGTPVGDAEGLFASWRVRSGVRRRFEADTAAVEKAIRDAQLADESVRSRLLKRLGEAAGALRASSVPAGESFRAVLPYNDAHADLFKVVVEGAGPAGSGLLGAADLGPARPVRCPPKIVGRPDRGPPDAR
jgi:hypothetical protein